MNTQSQNERDKGGRHLPGKRWRVFNFIVEVAVESPKDVSVEEAAEDASEFMSSRAHGMGRVHDSFASITRVDEYGFKRPPGGGVVIQNKYPKGEKADDEGLADFDVNGKKPKKAKPAKAVNKGKKKKRTARY